jgi:hypothetical protein
VSGFTDDEPFHFGGDTYDPDRDRIRLSRQWWDVWKLMRDGQWRTLGDISEATGWPEASVSARLRDFRKERFGAHTVEREYLHDGLWRYRLITNPRAIVEGPPELVPT